MFYVIKGLKNILFELIYDDCYTSLFNNYSHCNGLLIFYLSIAIYALLADCYMFCIKTNLYWTISLLEKEEGIK